MKSSFLILSVIFSSVFTGCEPKSKTSSFKSAELLKDVDISDQVWMKIYLYPFGSMTSAGLNCQDVMADAGRILQIRYPQRDHLALIWNKITESKYQFSSESRCDVRAVILINGQIIGFNADASSGVVDGKGVYFSQEVRNWFNRCIAPLTP